MIIPNKTPMDSDSAHPHASPPAYDSIAPPNAPHSALAQGGDDGHSPDETGPPAGFFRQPPPNLPSPSFSPIYLDPSIKNSLGKGFPAVPPPCDIQPHPFMIHDVTLSDWTRFILELQEMSKLSEKEKHLVHRIPILGILPFISPILSYGVASYVKAKKPFTAASVVDTWNRHFFHIRHLDVALYKGSQRLSLSSPNPDPVHSCSIDKGQFGDFQTATATTSPSPPVDPCYNVKGHFRLYVFPLP